VPDLEASPSCARQNSNDRVRQGGNNKGATNAGSCRLSFGARTLEQKRGLVKDITQAVVKNAGTNADQVTVSLVETPRTSKAKGGVLFSEMAPR
jgi:4-oxalocrotonate tautomerase